MSKVLIADALAAADSGSASAFMEFLTPDAAFIYGNSAPVVGHADIRVALDAFYRAVKKLRHDILAVYPCGDVWTVETAAHYTDSYDRQFSFPACNLLTLRDGRISVYKIFVDNSTMWLPPAKS